MTATTPIPILGLAHIGSFGPRAQVIFVRDPDRNVIELHQRG